MASINSIAESDHSPGIGVNHLLPGSKEIATRLQVLRQNIAKVFLGKENVIQLSLTALLAEGHLLVEDVPGVGKTLLAKGLAKSLDCVYHRIQFTPDLLPGDLLGTNIFHQPTGQFVFQPGPMFAQVILADEINRASPRTQSALLEAMSERQITLDGQSRPLGPPFFVIATQNPYEFEGTFPLPESQLDRFMIRLEIGYPDRSIEKDLLQQHRQGEPVDQLPAVLQTKDLLQLQQIVRTVKVVDSLAEYMIALIEATRQHPELALGCSTRGLLALYRAVQAWALLSDRDYAVPDDVKILLVPVLSHRVLSRRWMQGKRDDSTKIVLREILKQIPVPV